MTNPFINAHAPLLWASLLPEFGRVASYWPSGDEGAAADIPLIWIEGVEGEEVSPGRYSHAKVRHSDLPAPPALGDAVEMDGKVFDVVRIDAYAYGFSRLIFSARGGL